jgi:hypothetical protein
MDCPVRNLPNLTPQKKKKRKERQIAQNVGNYQTQLQRLIDCVLPTTHVFAGPNQMLRADYLHMQSTGFLPKEANY